jgi:hypothetical protein
VTSATVDPPFLITLRTCVCDLDDHVIGLQLPAAELVGRQRAAGVTRCPAQAVAIRALNGRRLQQQQQTHTQRST